MYFPFNLVVLIIVILVYSFRKETDDPEDDKNKFYSEDVLEKNEDI